MTKSAKIVWKIILVVVLVVVAFALAAFMVKFAWNHGIAPAFHTDGISFWTAFWLVFALYIVRGENERRQYANQITAAIRDLKRPQ